MSRRLDVRYRSRWDWYRLWDRFTDLRDCIRYDGMGRSRLRAWWR